MAGFYDKDGNKLGGNTKPKSGFYDKDGNKLGKSNTLPTKNILKRDGVTFGTITNAGLKAIEGNTLDDYTPASEEEKKTIENYKTYSKSPTTAKAWYDFGKIVADTYKKTTEKANTEGIPITNTSVNNTETNKGDNTTPVGTTDNTYNKEEKEDTPPSVSSENSALKDTPRTPTPYGIKPVSQSKTVDANTKKFGVEEKKHEQDLYNVYNLISMSPSELEAMKAESEKKGEVYQTASKILNFAEKAEQYKDKNNRYSDLYTKSALDRKISANGYSSLDEVKKAYDNNKNADVAYIMSDGTELTWDYVIKEAKVYDFEKVSQNQDFEKKSTYKKKPVEYETRSGYFNNIPITTSSIVKGTKNEHIYNLVNGDKDAYDYNLINNVAVYNTLDDTKNEYLKEDEKKVFNYLWETQGEEVAIAYLDLLSENLQTRRNEQEKIRWENYAKKHPIKSTIAEVLVSPFTNAISGVGALADYVDDGKIEENSALYTHQTRKNTVYDTVRSNIDSPVGRFFFNAGTNIGEQGMAMLVGGGNKFITLGTQVAGGFGNTVVDAKKRGLSDNQAFALGIISATAEIFFESKSFDALFDSKGLLKQSRWQYYKNNLKTEIPGELFTELVNDSADTLIGGDLSQWSLSIKNYMANGMTEEEAFKATSKDFALKYAETAGTTFVSTSVMSGSPMLFDYTITKTTKNSDIGKEVRKFFGENYGKDVTNDYIKDTLSFYPPDSNVYKLAKEAQSKIDAGKEVSDTLLGKIYRASVEQNNKKAETKTDDTTNAKTEDVTSESTPETTPVQPTQTPTAQSTTQTPTAQAPVTQAQAPTQTSVAQTPVTKAPVENTRPANKDVVYITTDKKGNNIAYGENAEYLAEQLDLPIHSTTINGETVSMVRWNDSIVSDDFATYDVIVSDTPQTKMSRGTKATPVQEAITETPTQEAMPVKVGETYTDTKNGDTIKIISRDDTTTTLEITDKDGNVGTAEFNNKQADMMSTNPRYAKVNVVESTAPQTPVTQTPVKETVESNTVASNETVDNTVPTDTASTVKSVSVGDTFTDSKYGNTITVVDRNDNHTIIAIDNGKKVITRQYTNDNVNKLITSERYVPVVKPVETINDTPTAVTPETNTIETNDTTLKTLRNKVGVSELFKSATQIVIGEDCIVSNRVAIPKTDELVKKIKNLKTKAEVIENKEITMERFRNNDTSVTISGDAKVGYLGNDKYYAFKVGDKFYIAEQRFLDQFNNGTNVIKAGANPQQMWNVFDKNGDLVGSFFPTSQRITLTQDQYDTFQSVSQTMNEKAEQKAKDSTAPMSKREIEAINKWDKLFFYDNGDSVLISDSHILLSLTKEQFDYVKSNIDNVPAELEGLSTAFERYTNLDSWGDVSEVKAVPKDIIKGGVVCVADNKGYLFSKTYYEQLKKHSHTISVEGKDGWNFTLVGYDESGKTTGIVLPIKHENQIIDSVEMYTGNNKPATSKPKSKASTKANATDTTKVNIEDASAENANVSQPKSKTPTDNAQNKPVSSETKSDEQTPNTHTEQSVSETEARKETEKKPKTEKPIKTTKEEVKAKTVETTVKLDDFGEKIGGARKDQWSSRGLFTDDLDQMNEREREKNVKKDNVWKRPNYQKLIESGGDRGLLWAVNEIRKSLNQNIYYGYKATEETKAEKQKVFIETIREIQSMAESAKTQADFEAMGEKWLIDNGYLKESGKLYPKYYQTQKFFDNPALAGGSYFETVKYLAKNFDNLSKLAEKDQFAIDTKSQVPKGFSIVGGEGSVGSKLVNGEWVKDESYSVAKGRMIIQSGFATREEALEWLKQGIAKKKSKTRFVPQQLLEVHRKGADYRDSKSVTGQNYIDTFGFKGGEFGNWMSAKDRQVSLDYGFDALKDLADALNIEDSDISLGGNLNIAFGARGQGLSGASAHYENMRRVINLTKMNGAGSLAHEWFHALDDFIGGYTNNYATNKYNSLPEKTKGAIRDLITVMQYKDATQEETDLARQKRYEQSVRSVKYQLENLFKWVEKVENGTLTDADTRYFKRKPTKADAEKYRSLYDSLIETGDNKYIKELSALRKEVYGHVISADDTINLEMRLLPLKPENKNNIQVGRKRTDFYTESQKFGQLHSKDGDYWDSTVEMSARAFACYVADKTNKQNDYLSAHSDSAVTLDSDKDGNLVVVRAFPVGDERKAINKAFDNLIEALKSDGFLHEKTPNANKPKIIQYSINEESEKFGNEQTGKDLLSDNTQRTTDESTRKQVSGLSETDRKRTAKEIRNKGQSEQQVIGDVTLDVVKEEAYNDDMKSIIESNKDKGINTHFFLGNGLHETNSNLIVDGMIDGNDVYLRYDGKFAPQVLNRHESVHDAWETPEVQAVADEIWNSLSKAEQNAIFKQERYKNYAEMYKGDMELVKQEFIADVLAGMTSYTKRFDDTIMSYWNNAETIDNFKVSEYTHSTDAGGTGGMSNGSVIDGTGTDRVFGEDRDTPRRDRSNTENIHNEVSTGESEGKYRKDDWKGKNGKTSHIHSLGRSLESKLLSQEKNRAKTDGRRFLEAISNNKYDDARKLLNEQAEAHGYKAIYLYHGTVDGKPFDPFTKGKPVWVTEDKEYAEYYAISYKNNGDPLLKLFYDGNLSVFELYAKKGKTLDVGNINQEIVELEDFKAFADRVGFSISEISKCWSARGTDDSSIWTMTNTKEFADIAREHGYDSLRAIEYGDVETFGILYPNNLKSSKLVTYDDNGNIIPLDKRFDNSKDSLRYSIATDESVDTDTLSKEWDEALEKYGAIKKGETPTRDIDVPKKRSKNEPISLFGRTALEAGITPNEVIDDFQREVMFGKMAHEVITDKKAEQDAIKKIEKLGFDEALNNWNVLVEEGKIGKNDFVFGMVLYNQAVTNKDYKLAMKLISDLTVEATNSAQVLQSIRMLKKMSPDGTLYYLEKSVEKMNEEFREQLGDKFEDIEIDPELMKDLFEAKTEEERNTALEKIEQNIAEQIPSKLSDKVNAWRYLAMLGNLKTHARNVFGNMTFWATRKLKNVVGTMLEKFISKDKRTKSIKKTKESVEFAKEDVKVMKDILTGTGGKYEIANKIQQKRKVFETKWLEFIRRKNFDFLEAEDWWFLNGAYQDSLAQIITARKIDVNFLKSGTKEANDLLNKIRAYAINEAKEATFRQASELGNAINKAKRKLSKGKIGSKAVGLLMEGLLPFTNVPINIAKQGVAYSPLGLVKGIYEVCHDVKKGNKTASEAINTLSKGLTGSLIVALGVLLRAMGILVAEVDDDDKKNEHDKMNGKQSYALQIGDHSYTIDWFNPSAMPLFVGVELYDLTSDGSTSAEDIINSLSRIGDPMIELSVLQGVSDALSNAKYTEENPMIAVPIGMLTSYIGQAFPTLGGQIARLIDDNQRTVYTDKGEGFFTGQLSKFIQTTAKKIPFASMLLEPQINAWGEEKTYGNVVERIAESTISPGYYSKITSTEVDDELNRLFEATGDNSVYPTSKTVKSITVKKKEYKLNASQSTEYARERGQRSLKYVTELMNKIGYENLPEEKKVKRIKEAYEKAKEEAKDAIFEKYFKE